jgi:hypothetical protein
VRTSRILLTALTAAAAAVAAVPAAATDLTGTVTVHEVTATDGGGNKDVSVVWTFDGTLRRQGRTAVASAMPAVLAFTERSVITAGYGTPSCTDVAVAGWAGAGNPATQSFELLLDDKDLLTGRADGSLLLAGTGPTALRSGGPCGTPPGGLDPVPLVAPDVHPPLEPPSAVIGVGDLATETGTGAPSTATSYLSPGPIAFRRAGGGWRADGTRTRTGTFEEFALGRGTKTVEIEWHLGSRSPSDRCAVPGFARVRGRTPAQVARVLRRAGLRAGLRRRDLVAPVRVGRVSGVLHMGGSARCGSPIAMWVRA